jgi:hypothetical protein
MTEPPNPPTGEIVLYETADGKTRVECRFAQETLWPSQALIAELFQVSIPTVNEHIKNIYDEGELSPNPTLRKFRIVRREGTREVGRELDHFSLEGRSSANNMAKTNLTAILQQHGLENVRAL